MSRQFPALEKDLTERKKSVEGSSMALTAVALQDHWTRTLSMGTHFGPKRVGLGPAARAKQKPVAKSVIDTGLHRDKKKNKTEDKKEKEYVLDEKPPPLTLAQKFGLVNAPKPLLSEDDWQKVKGKSNRREDSGEPCVICKEDFGLQEQVLLSCTHVFHRACLQAFERFTGRKTCPMCRHEQYQTRVIHEGARIHRHKCATKIQSQWRGYVVRCWYKQLRQTVPPKDPKLRKKFYEEKLSAIVDRMIKSIDVNMAQFLQEIDTSVQNSRAVFDQWDAMHSFISDEQWEDIQLKAIQRGCEDCPICLTELQLEENEADTNSSSNQDENENNLSTKPHQKDHKTRQKHADKKLLEKLAESSGNVHINPSDSTTKLTKNKPSLKANEKLVNENNSVSFTSQKKKSRSTVLLSCTHVFHATCLTMLEQIAMVDMRNTCPVCRAHYQKKVIVH